MISDAMRLEVTSLMVGHGAAPLMQAFSTSLRHGEGLLIAGSNGVGKTTLLNTIGQALPPLAGSIKLDSVSLDHVGPGAARRAGVIRAHQRPRIVADLSVAENVLLGCLAKADDFVKSSFGIANRDKGNRISHLLARLGMEDLRNTKGSELSVGQRRAVENARALGADGVALMLFDEPLANLQEEAVASFMGLLRERMNEGAAVIIVEHVRGSHFKGWPTFDLDIIAMHRSA